ncbi:MAG: hypothetical protein IKH45_05840 [Neisseriaceae bacterium]|nr:hypothetical protein [Neisseriaceae bacterium]
MSLQRDIVDIYTKSSVYYLRLQYLVVCYLIVLAGAFFILPLPREMGINGNARLMVGGLLYIGFAVLLVYAPKLFYPLIGKLLSPYKDEKEVEEKFNQLSDKEKRELERELKREYGRTIKQNGVLIITMSKVKRIATNLFFQCLLLELFGLTILINGDYSLLISNPLTQHIADILQNYTSNTPPKYDENFFTISNITTKDEGSPVNTPFSQYAYMAESIFFIYIIFIISVFVRLFLMFIFIRPLLSCYIIKNMNTIFALLGTLIMLFVAYGAIIMFLEDLELFIIQIIDFRNWFLMSCGFFSIGILNVLIFWLFIEYWFKKAIGLI